VKRGDVYDARLDPIEGSEQGGSRPVVIVSRDAINKSSPVVLAVPCTTYRPDRRIYPSQVLVKAPRPSPWCPLAERNVST
jgi:mRNA interferase MazF